MLYIQTHSIELSTSNETKTCHETKFPSKQIRKWRLVSKDSDPPVSNIRKIARYFSHKTHVCIPLSLSLSNIFLFVKHCAINLAKASLSETSIKHASLISSSPSVIHSFSFPSGFWEYKFDNTQRTNCGVPRPRRGLRECMSLALLCGLWTPTGAETKGPFSRRL